MKSEPRSGTPRLKKDIYVYISQVRGIHVKNYNKVKSLMQRLSRAKRSPCSSLEVAFPKT